MSKFLKFIVNLFLICAILVAGAILIPPLCGVHTAIIDSQMTDTNLPMGSVTYAKDIYVTEIAQGDKILVESDESIYVYAIETTDASAGRFTAWDFTNASAEAKELQILNTIPKRVYTVPYIGYVVYAMHSIEGIIILALVVLLMIILFILSELWRNDDDDDDEEEDDLENLVPFDLEREVNIRPYMNEEAAGNAAAAPLREAAQKTVPLTEAVPAAAAAPAEAPAEEEDPEAAFWAEPENAAGKTAEIRIADPESLIIEETDAEETPEAEEAAEEAAAAVPAEAGAIPVEVSAIPAEVTEVPAKAEAETPAAAEKAAAPEKAPAKAPAEAAPKAEARTEEPAAAAEEVPALAAEPAAEPEAVPQEVLTDPELLRRRAEIESALKNAEAETEALSVPEEAAASDGIVPEQETAPVISEEELYLEAVTEEAAAEPE